MPYTFLGESLCKSPQELPRGDGMRGAASLGLPGGISAASCQPLRPAKGSARIQGVDAVTVGVWVLRVRSLKRPHFLNRGLLPGVRDDFSSAHQWLHVPRVGEYDPSLSRRLVKRACHISDDGP